MMFGIAEICTSPSVRASVSDVALGDAVAPAGAICSFFYYILLLFVLRILSFLFLAQLETSETSL